MGRAALRLLRPEDGHTHGAAPMPIRLKVYAHAPTYGPSADEMGVTASILITGVNPRRPAPKAMLGELNLRTIRPSFPDWTADSLLDGRRAPMWPRPRRYSRTFSRVNGDAAAGAESIVRRPEAHARYNSTAVWRTSGASPTLLSMTVAVHCTDAGTILETTEHERHGDGRSSDHGYHEPEIRCLLYSWVSPFL